VSWITPASAAFWPIFLWLLSSRFSVGLHKAAIITVYVLAAVVGYSRLVIHVHSVSEVVAGPLLATLCSCCCKNVPLIRKA
jgi:membrane-associated phospholipid phosphatase